MPQTFDAETLARFIADVNENGRGLTAWELSFMESVTDQFERTGRLSERQQEVLDRIRTEKTP